MRKEDLSRFFCITGLVLLLIGVVSLCFVLPDYVAWVEVQKARAAMAAGNPGSDLIPAPDFTLTDQYGYTITLSDYTDQIVVLQFVKDWDNPKQAGLADLQAMQREYADSEVRFMAVLVDVEPERREEIIAFLREKRYSFPVMIDSDLQVAVAFGLRYAPSTVFINDQGNIAGAVEGRLSLEAYRTGIQLSSTANYPKADYWEQYEQNRESVAL